MRTIAVITGTRAEYGILKPVLKKIEASPALTLRLIVTGMHLCPDYGYTVDQIVADGFPIAARVEMILSSDTTAAMGKSLGIGITGLCHQIEHLKPDVVLVLGDRIEAFAGATAGLFCGTAIAHLHGGDITQGGLDEYMRHAITKLSHIHFPATPKSRERILHLGENPDFVYTVGTPGLDAILAFPDLSNAEISARLGIRLPDRFVLLCQHPISTLPETAARELRETLLALQEARLPTILLYPNADAGSRQMLHEIRQMAKQDWLISFPSLPRDLYCNLLKRALMLVGNSSSGMIDAPAYGVPVINIGDRQAGRERGENVLDSPPERHAIAHAIHRALTDTDFIEKAQNTGNPYGDGKASERICRTLENVDLHKAKGQKQFVC